MMIRRSMQVCQDIIEHLQTEPDLLYRDEAWVSEYDPETKQFVEVSDVTKAEESKTVKVMLIMFFNVRGIVQCKFLQQG